MTTIKVTRDKLCPVFSHPGPAWRWIYTYKVDDGPEREFGTELASLRRMLKKHFPGAQITYMWGQ